MDAHDNHFPYIVFELNDDLYALNVEHVTEVTNTGELSPLPQMSSFMLGLFQLREDVLPVIDLKSRIGLTDSLEGTRHNEEKFIIVKTKKKYIGLKVDAVREIFQFDRDQFRDVTLEEEKWSDMVEGIYRWNRQLILILNLDAILDFKTLIDLSDWKDKLQQDEDEADEETENGIDEMLGEAEKESLSDETEEVTAIAEPAVEKNETGGSEITTSKNGG